MIVFTILDISTLLCNNAYFSCLHELSFWIIVFLRYHFLRVQSTYYGNIQPLSELFQSNLIKDSYCPTQSSQSNKIWNSIRDFWDHFDGIIVSFLLIIVNSGYQIVRNIFIILWIHFQKHLYVILFDESWYWCYAWILFCFSENDRIHSVLL